MTKNRKTFLIAFSLVLITSIFLFKDYLLLNKVYLFADIGSDTIQGEYPTIFHTSSELKNGNLPFWSFKEGIGQGVFPESLNNIFNYIFFFFKLKNIANITIYVEVLKVFFAFYFFFLFLRELNFSSFSQISGSFFYAFSGYLISTSTWWHEFTTLCVYFAFFLLASEKLLKGKNLSLFIIAIFLITSLNPFNLFVLGLFFTIYFFFKFLTFESKQKIDKFFKTIFLMAILMVLGIGLSAVFSLTILEIIFKSERTGSSSLISSLFHQPIFKFNDPIQSLTIVSSFFGNNLLGNALHFRGWLNYFEAPAFYVGILNLILFPQTFTFLDKRKKKIYFFILFFFLLPLIFPYFRYAIWGFTGDYYRIFSLLVAFVTLFLSLKTLTFLETKKLNLKVHLFVSVFLFLLLIFPLFTKYGVLINREVLKNTIFFLLLYSSLIPFFKRKTIKFLLLSLFVFEIFILSGPTVNQREAIKKKDFENAYYNDGTKEIVKYIKSHDKSFFRIVKDYDSNATRYTGANDAKVQDYFGVSSYYTFHPKTYIDFLKEFGGLREHDFFHFKVLKNIAPYIVLQSFVGVKYAILKTSNIRESFVRSGFFVEIGKTRDEKFSILRNRLSLPFSFPYKKYIFKRDVKNLSLVDKQWVLFDAFFINENDKELQKLFPKTNKIFSINKIYKTAKNLRENALKIEEFSQNRIKGSITNAERCMLFFSILYDKGWKVKVDGKEEKLRKINVGFSGVILEKGSHTVELTYMPAYFFTGVIISLVSLLLIFLFFLIYKKKGISKFFYE